MIDILITGIGSRRGGVGSVILNLLKELDRQMFSPTILLTYDSELEPDIKSLNVSILKVTPFGKSIKKYRNDLNRIFASHKFDYVWINNTSKVDVIIFQIAKKYAVRTIAHSHGTACEGSLLKKSIFKIWEFFTSRSFYKNLDIAIACSQKSAEYFYSKNYRDKNKVHVLLNSIDVDMFKFDSAARTNVREELCLKEEKAIFAVGRITQVKNPFFMIKLIDSLPKLYKLVLVGDGDLLEEIMSFISERQLEDRVMILGSRKDVARLLNGADIFILPSFNEGYPVAVVEAQANGLTCIISDTITQEVLLFDDCVSARLNDINGWKHAILNVKDKKREGFAHKVEELGFDNKAYAVKFEQIILSDFYGI